MRRFLLILFTIHYSLFTPFKAEAQEFSVQPIPDSVFLRMQGRSWPEGCTVRRDDLRYLRLSHFDAEKKEHVGEMVCNKAIANDLLEIFRELYRQKYPIQRIRLIDDYEAIDERSMRDITLPVSVIAKCRVPLNYLSMQQVWQSILIRSIVPMSGLARMVAASWSLLQPQSMWIAERAFLIKSSKVIFCIGFSCNMVLNGAVPGVR